MIKKNLIGATIIHKGVKYLVEDTEQFKKVAKKYGFNVFEKPKRKTKVDADTDAGE